MTYGPLLNLKVAQKKTSAGSVPMVRHSHLFVRARVFRLAKQLVGRLSIFSA